MMLASMLASLTVTLISYSIGSESMETKKAVDKLQLSQDGLKDKQFSEAEQKEMDTHTTLENSRMLLYLQNKGLAKYKDIQL